MTRLSYDDRSSFEAEIRHWAIEANVSDDYSFVIHPPTKWGVNMGLKATAIVTIPPKDDDVGDTKWTAFLRDDGEIIWWEQRAML